MRVRARAGMAIVVVVASLATVGCDSKAQAGSSGLADRASVTIESPTYFPAGLPGGFGVNPVRFRGRPGEYSVTARAHDTTYTIRAATNLHGTSTLDPAKLATFPTRTSLQPDGTVHWRDQVADVTISAIGPAGHARQGLQAIGKRMVVVPHSVLAQLVGATRERHRRELDLEPARFSGTSFPQTMYGWLGRAAIQIRTGAISSGMNVCFACESLYALGGWRENGTLFELIAAPPSMIVHPKRGVRVERQFDSAFGSDLVLLSTERTDHPTVFVEDPHGARSRRAHIRMAVTPPD